MQNSTVVFTILRSTNNPNIITKLNLSLYNDSNGDQLMFALAISKVLIPNVLASAELMIKTDPKSQNYDLTVFKSSFNYCRMLNGLTGNFFFRTILESLKSNGQKLHKCPFPPGSYEYKGIRVSDQYLPKFLLLNEIHFRGQVKMFGKLENTKTSVEIFKLQLMGVINRD